MLSVLVQLTDSDYPFDILKLFFLIHDFLPVFVTRVTRRVLHMKQELVTLSEHLSAPQVFIGVPVTQSLILYVCCADRCLSFCPSSFGHCVVCSSVFWPLCCLFFCLLAIVLSVLLFIDADYHFGIFNLFSLPKSKITDVVSHLPDDGMLIISHITITLHVLGLLAIFCPCYCTIGKPHMHLLFEETMNDQCAKAPVSVELTIILTLCVLFLNWNYFL